MHDKTCKYYYSCGLDHCPGHEANSGCGGEPVENNSYYGPDDVIEKMEKLHKGEQ